MSTLRPASVVVRRVGVSRTTIGRVRSRRRILRLAVCNQINDPFINSRSVSIYTITKTTSVGDGRLSVVGAAGWAWSKHATVSASQEP